jgi:hypothetical protein
MSIPRRYRDVLHKLREREVWLVDELPHECNAETLTYFDQKGLISWQFVSWSNQGQGKPPLAVRHGWNEPGITIDRTGDSWERQLAQRRNDGLHPTELKVSPHGHSVLTELAAADADAQATENERRLQEESRQVGILAASIRASLRENPALMEAIRRTYSEAIELCNSLCKDNHTIDSTLTVDESIARSARPFVIIDAVGNATHWALLDADTKMMAGLFAVGGVYDTGTGEPIVPFPSDPRMWEGGQTDAWRYWLQRLWVRDPWRYRSALLIGQQASVPFEAKGFRSARALEDVWHYVQLEFAGSTKQPVSTSLAPRIAMTNDHVLVLAYLAKQSVLKTQVVMCGPAESGITNREKLGDILADLVSWGFVHTPKGERKGYQILPAGKLWLASHAAGRTK